MCSSQSWIKYSFVKGHKGAHCWWQRWAVTGLGRIIHTLLRSSHFCPKAMGWQYRIVVRGFWWLDGTLTRIPSITWKHIVCVCVGGLHSVAQSHVPLCDPMDWNPPGSSYPRSSLGKNTGEGSLSLLQGSSSPRDQTQVSCIVGRFFTIWATREDMLKMGKINLLSRRPTLTL